MMGAGLECSIIGAIPSLRNRILLAGLAFSLVLIVGYGADLLLVQHPTWMFADDLIIALGAAAVVFYYEREQSRILSERLRIIRDMNSFVRNELQILYACLENPGKSRAYSTIDARRTCRYALFPRTTARHSANRLAHQSMSAAIRSGTMSNDPPDFPTT